MLNRDEIRALEDIVGAKWVNDDPCMMDTYSFYMNPEIVNKDGSLWLPRPSAVVTPADTKEVSEILKACNRLKMIAKPISTGWAAVAAATRDRVVILDLKRMNKIIDIDEKNMVAVVEPYVKAILLQSILWKKGLNLHIISCGGNHSALASTTSAWGTGLDGPSMGYSGRNLLGVEWVLPTGDIYTMGSAGHGSNWFTADGPGPSMRGIARGYIGAFGGLGVFTKCAIKLYRWDGQDELEVGGASPHYTVKNIPPNLGLFVLSFPDSKSIADAGYKLGEEDITYADFRLPAFYNALGATEDNLELKQIWESGVFQKIAKYNFIAAVIGRSQREFEWKYKAMREIVHECGGAILPVNQQPDVKAMKIAGPLFKLIDNPHKILNKVPWLLDFIGKLPINEEAKLNNISGLFWVLLRHANNTQGNFRPSQAMLTSLGGFDTWDMGMTAGKWITGAKKDYMEKGLFLDDGGDLACGGTFEAGHMGYLEGIVMYSSKDPKSVIAARQVVGEAVDACIDKALGTPIAGFGVDMNEKLGPHCGNYHHWMSKIKKALDPNTACDPFFYAEPEEKAS